MIFKYQAMDSTGQESWGEVEADTLELATAKLRSQGLFVTKIHRKAPPLGQRSSPKSKSVFNPYLEEALLKKLIYGLWMGISIAFIAGVVFWISIQINSVDARNKAAKTDPACQINLKASRVLMHLPDEYTFIVEEGEELKLYSFSKCIVKWIRDARLKEPIRVEGYKDVHNVYLTVHLHDANEIDGAGWQRSQEKFIENGNISKVE